MQMETWFKVEYNDCIGDVFDENISEKDKKELIEQHIQDYCKQHNIDRNSIKIIKFIAIL